MIEEIFKFPVQLGFDVATSITIIGSLIYFVYTTKKRIDEERFQRFDKNARAVAAEQLKESIKEMSKVFIDDIVASYDKTTSISGLKSNPSQKDPQEAISEKIKKSDNLEDILLNINLFNDNMGSFYELVQANRYTLIPVIDSIEEGSELVKVLKEQISNVISEYNKSNRGTSSLITELKNLSKIMDKLTESNNLKSFDEILENEEILNQLTPYAVSIVSDEDYYDWLWRYLPEGKEESFLHAIKTSSSTSEMSDEMKEVFTNCCIIVLKSLFEDRHWVYAGVLEKGINAHLRNTAVCKEILVNLSAILKYLLAKDGSHQSINSLISEYESETHFALKKEIR